MTGVLGPTGDVHRARDLAQRLLVGLPERWRHTIGVARRAEAVAGTVWSRSEGDVLVEAAWLHDIGYGAALRDTGSIRSTVPATWRRRGGRRGLSVWSRTTPRAYHVAQVRGDSPNAAAHARRAPLLREAVDRVEQRLAARGHPSSAA